MKVTFYRVVVLALILIQIWATTTDKPENLKSNLILLALLPIVGAGIEYYRNRKNGLK